MEILTYIQSKTTSEAAEKHLTNAVYVWKALKGDKQRLTKKTHSSERSVQTLISC